MAANEPLIDASDEPDAPGDGVQQLTAAFARLSRTYELILHATTEGVLGLDQDGRINYANAAAGRMLGRQVEDMLGQTVDVVVGRGADSTAEAAGTVPWRPPFTSEQARRRSEFHRPGGAAFAVEYSVARIIEDEACEGAVLVFSDVSDRDRAERALQESLVELRETNQRLSDTRDQLLQSEKMAAIGQLAAGVAHEINTPIGYVKANVGTLLRYFNDLMTLVQTYEQTEHHLDSEHQALLRAARQACDLDFLREDTPALLNETQSGLASVARIVRELMEFSASGEQGEWQSSDLQQLIEGAIIAAASRTGSDATIVREQGELPPIFCLASGIRQVFSNLLVNAMQAVGQGGRIVVRCAGEDGERVRVEIEDDGEGITEENLARVFNPFFTTRPVGSGTGMGLSVADTIVRRHGGRIEIDSARGRGTTVRVTLPLAPEAVPGSTS
ncbi:nitrogen regulation protein NR(II) [Azoarcus sp. KH32C]|uniref:two-component system sensor histidine kinase NtrB n=1 Tax=Azoarcus sp. KH32C TaxID=748247 RepID=UPI00023869BE|nr:ATP-binding protein [Azoarcus sp. KH32C]BAL26470.1 putative two-component sensor histidine kinase [Azoarcus sp. KH32C]